jgi:hypothetical protein
MKLISLSLLVLCLTLSSCQQKFNETKTKNDNNKTTLRDRSLKGNVSQTFKAIYTVNVNGKKTLVGAEGVLKKKDLLFTFEKPLSVDERTTNITLEIDNYKEGFGDIYDVKLDKYLDFDKSDFSYAVDEKNNTLVLSLFGVNKIDAKKGVNFKANIYSKNKKQSELNISLRELPSINAVIENDKGVIESLKSHSKIRILGDTYKALVYFKVKNTESNTVNLILKNKSVNVLVEYEERVMSVKECSFSEAKRYKTQTEEAILVPILKSKADALSKYTEEEESNIIIPLHSGEELLFGAYIADSLPKFFSWENLLPKDTLYVVANSCEEFCKGDHLYRRPKLSSYYSGARNYKINIPELSSITYRYKEENKHFPDVTLESKDLQEGSFFEKPIMVLHRKEYPFQEEKKIKHNGCYNEPPDPCKTGHHSCPR